MRRPVACMAAAFGLGIILSFHLPENPVIWLVFFTTAMAVTVYLLLEEERGIKYSFSLCFCALALGGLMLQAESCCEDPLLELEGQKTKITGVVREVTIEENGYSLIVETGTGKTLVKYYGEQLLQDNCKGLTAEIYGKIERPQGRRNPRCFDYSLYLRSCGIMTIMKADSVSLSERGKTGHLYAAGKLRSSFENRMRGILTEDKAGFITAIMFGDKTYIDEDTYNEFQKNGTAHVLAVSGLHTGILYGFFVLLWRWKKGLLFNCVTCVMLLLYVSLADFSPSVVRAAVMILLHSGSLIVQKRYDLLTAAGITFFIMLADNPYQLFHTGFQLSFLAIVSLAVLLPFMNKFYQGILLSSVAIQAGMMPYNAFVFNYVSLGGIVANVPVIFIAGIMLPVGLTSLVFAFVPGNLFGFLLTVLDICCDLLIWINDLFYASGRTSFDVTGPPVWMLIIYYGLLFLFLSETGQLMIIRKQKNVIGKCAAAVCVAAVLSVPVTATDFDKAGIVFVDVGQGDCMHIRTPDGKNYLIDGGGSADYDVGLKTLKPYLLKNGVRKIDAAFVTHLHQDHYGGIRTLAADGMIDKIAVYEGNRIQEAGLQEETGTEIVYLKRGDLVHAGKDVEFQILSPEGKTEEEYEKLAVDEEDENATSLIIKVIYNKVCMLVTGDIDSDGELGLMNLCGRQLSSDIIKVPHHGSRYSSSEEFVKAVCPRLAVFQVGRNNYGHPAEEIIERYENEGCPGVRNDTEGAIGIIIDDSRTFKVTTMIN